MTAQAMTDVDELIAVAGVAEDAEPSVWLTRPELADRLRMPVSTLANWACSGTGPRYARFGKYVRYRLSDVVAWEEQHIVGSES